MPGNGKWSFVHVNCCGAAERIAQATEELRDLFGFSKIQFGGSATKSRK
jgi:transcriptional regulator with AAA-type ATPase domain